MDQLRAELTGLLWQDRIFSSLAMPKRITRCIFSRYEPGMHYGDHLDSTIMDASIGDPIRADMSMTLFVNDPESYDGGELVLYSDSAPVGIKLKLRGTPCSIRPPTTTGSSR